MEVWKDIKGYESLYQVSNLGRVKRIEAIVKYSNGIYCKHKERLLKQEVVKNNYNRVTLSKNNKLKRFQVMSRML